MEREIQTKSWLFRVNLSILGMSIVDNWMICKATRGSDSIGFSQNEIYEKLAQEFVDNNCDQNSLSVVNKFDSTVTPSSFKDRGLCLTPTNKKENIGKVQAQILLFRITILFIRGKRQMVAQNVLS